MNNDDIRRLENFNFSAFLYQLKEEMGISYKRMAELADIPYTVLYKYTSGAKTRPSLIDFYKIMELANRSIDNFFLKLLHRPDQYSQFRYFINHQVSEEEILLLKKLHTLNSEHKQIILSYLSELIDML